MKSGARAVGAETGAVVRASRALLAIVARSVAPALESVTLPQFRVLVVLDAEGSMRVGLLAERLGAVVSTFSRALDRLEAAGWLVRRQSEDSRREINVAITDQGRALVRQVTDARSEEIGRVLGRLDADERKALVAALDRFAAAAGEPELRDLLTLGL